MSRVLVERVARERGAYLPIVMSTVAAESNFRNILGRYAAESARWGAGFGQVHPAWHASSVRAVAARLGVSLPPDFAGVPFRPGDQVWDRYARGDRTAIAVRQVIDEIILRDDVFSAHLAVDVIMAVWRRSGQDFDRFVEAYVGPNIPQADRERRRVKFERWRRYYRDRVIAHQPEYQQPEYQQPVLGVYREGDAYMVQGVGFSDLRSVGFALGALGLGVLMLYLQKKSVESKDEEE